MWTISEIISLYRIDLFSLQCALSIDVVISNKKILCARLREIHHMYRGMHAVLHQHALYSAGSQERKVTCTPRKSKKIRHIHRGVVGVYSATMQLSSFGGGRSRYT